MIDYLSMHLSPFIRGAAKLKNRVQNRNNNMMNKQNRMAGSNTSICTALHCSVEYCTYSTGSSSWGCRNCLLVRFKCHVGSVKCTVHLNGIRINWFCVLGCLLVVVVVVDRLLFARFRRFFYRSLISSTKLANTKPQTLKTSPEKQPLKLYRFHAT